MRRIWQLSFDMERMYCGTWYVITKQNSSVCYNAPGKLAALDR
jgi:hypothetical protein